jgi:hypothetical protein
MRIKFPYLGKQEYTIEEFLQREVLSEEKAGEKIIKTIGESVETICKDFNRCKYYRAIQSMTLEEKILIEDFWRAEDGDDKYRKRISDKTHWAYHEPVFNNEFFESFSFEDENGQEVNPRPADIVLDDPFALLLREILED